MENALQHSPNSPNQTTETVKQAGNNGNNVTRTRANRRIDAKTISEIARLTAKQLTESEACRLLGINPRQWFSWKSRHNRAEKFADLLEEFRAGRIDGLIARIEASADGVGMKQPDWRAAAHLLSLVDAKRFSDSGMRASIEIGVGVNVQPIISDAKLKEICDRVYGAETAKPVEIQAVEVKQIAKP
jgi:hypothetical protein